MKYVFIALGILAILCIIGMGGWYVALFGYVGDALIKTGVMCALVITLGIAIYKGFSDDLS